MQDVSLQFQMVLQQRGSIDELIPFTFESSRFNHGLKPPWPGV